MHLEFVNGPLRYLFDARIEYEIERFEFLIDSFRTPYNIKEILKQYAEIDLIHRVDLIGQTPVPIRRVSALLNGQIHLFAGREIVSWTPVFARPSPFLQHRLAEPLSQIIEPVQPAIVTTVRAVLPELKERKRQEVRQAAALRARIMRDNANAILTFLNIPE